MDLSVDPAEDFYRFANGGWLDRTEIPSDRPSYGPFDELDELTQQQMLDLITDLASDNDLKEGTDQWKAVRLFEQGVDLESRNEIGIAPIEPALAEIEQITDLESLHTFLETSRFEGAYGFFSIDAYSDLEDSTVWAAYLSGPQLWLPNRDYYLDDDPSLEEIRVAYIDAMSQLLQYAGYDEARADTAAQAVYDLEKRLAAETLTNEEQQDVSLINNPKSVAELEEIYPLMDWASYMEELGLPPDQDRVLVTELKYLEALDAIMTDTDVEVLKDMLTLQLLWTNRIYLDEDIQDISFNFRSRILFGLEELPPIEERVLGEVNGQLGEAMGQLYVAEYFPPEAKAQITDLVDAEIAAFRIRIEGNPWMSEEAKAEALDKLSNIIVKVGYPDTWRSYDQVEIQDSYSASSQSATNAEYRRMLARVGEPVDKTEWFIPPQVVNAFYDPSENSITFPAAILQPPFFDYQGDAATNYGGIGAVIGHELTHGFDLQGSQFDAEGNLNNWWTEADQTNFDELNQRVVDQYGAIEVLPGLNINGQITVTENVADMGGLQIAYDALEIHLAAEGEVELLASPGASPVSSPMATPVGATPMASPVALIDFEDLTPQQRFFISAATIWRQEITDEYLETLVRSDEHAPGQVRGTIPLQHMDEFYDAFDIQPGDPMYLPPEERIVIW
jgi:predicted metalloendopeptidase